jgi:hypothetical protein
MTSDIKPACDIVLEPTVLCVPSIILNVKPKPTWLNDETDFRQRGGGGFEEEHTELQFTLGLLNY